MKECCSAARDWANLSSLGTFFAFTSLSFTSRAVASVLPLSPDAARALPCSLTGREVSSQVGLHQHLYFTLEP